MVVRSALCASHPLVFTPRKIPCVRGWVNPRTIVRLERLGKLKNPVTSEGIEPTTFRLVAVPQPTMLLRAPSVEDGQININISSFSWKNKCFWCEVWGSPSSDYEEYCLPECDDMLFGKSLLMFRRNVLLPSSCCLVSLSFSPEDDCGMFLQNIGKLYQITWPHIPKDRTLKVIMLNFPLQFCLQVMFVCVCAHIYVCVCVCVLTHFNLW
jgi:hypothetical protein